MTKYGWVSPELYSEFKYGLTAETTLLWSIEVDWDNDGVFDGSNEGGYVHYLETTRGRDWIITPKGQGFELIPIGEAVIRLYNDTGRYDPYNAAGPLFGNIRPGREVRIRVKNGTAGVNYPVFAGRIYDIRNYGRRGTTDIYVRDGWELLKNADAHAAVQEYIYADDAIDAIADYAEYQWGTSLDRGSDLIHYWWADSGNAKRDIENVCNSELGHVFVAKDGTLTYHSRHHSDTPLHTFTQDLMLKDVEVPQPWEFERNIIKVQAQPRVKHVSRVLWTLNEAPYLEPDEEYEVWTPYKYENIDCAAINVITPVSGTDFIGNVNEDGTGEDLSANFTLTFSELGNTSKIILKNDGATGCFLSTVQVRGQPINAPDTAPTYAYAGSYATDPRRFEIDLPWLQSTGIAQNLADFLATYFVGTNIFPKGFVECRPTVQFPPELFDAATLNLASWGINDTFRIGKIKHKWLDKTGQDVRTEFRFEPSYGLGNLGYWKLGDAALSLLNSTTYVVW